MTFQAKTELTQRIADMRQTMSAASIAKELGMTRQNVFYHLRKSRVVMVDDYASEQRETDAEDNTEDMG